MRTYHTLRTVAALGLLVGLQALQAQPLTGTYTINGTSAFASNQFATIQEAFDSLNQRGASGVVVFNVGDNWDPANEPNTITLAGYNCNTCQVTLNFGSLTTNKVLAKAPTGMADYRFVFRFGGRTQSTLATVNNPGQITRLTLIGHDSLIVRSTATGATTTGVIGLVSTNTTPLAVDGLTIRGFRLEGNGRAKTFSGIYVGPDASLNTSVPAMGTVQGLQIIRNTVDSVSRPIYVRGVRSNFGTINKPIVIDSNLIGLASPINSWAAASNIGGIHVAGARFVRVRHNTVTGAQSDVYYQFSGVRLDSCENFEISRNHIYGLKYTGGNGWGMYGIFVRFPSSFSLPNPSHRIENNMIADIVGDAWNSPDGVVGGIVVDAAASLAAANLSIVHNSIHLFGTNTASNYAGGGSAAIRLGPNITGGVVIEGNILQNNLNASTGAGKLAYGIWIDVPSPSGFTINYNAYWVNASGTNVTNHIARRVTTNFTTFAAWQSAGYEANGVGLGADVPFVSPTDLHINPSVETQVINAGNPAYNGTLDDFDGQGRPLPNPGPGANGDPGTAPDIGADELDGTPFTCPTALAAPDVFTTTPPNAGTGTDYLWGTTIELDTNSSTASGALRVIYSLDGGATWTAGPSISGFPANFTLPNPTPPNYTGTILIAIEATTPSSCPALTPDTSNAPLSLDLTDRPGNRAANAIPLTLAPGAGGVWVVIVQDSTNGPGTTDEFRTATGARYGQASNDLFFKLQLPKCFDSLIVYTCNPTNTSYDTRIHLLNSTQSDTLSNDDGNGCASSNGPFASRVIAIDYVSRNSNRSSSLFSTLRDSIPLRASDELYIVVEGYGLYNGRFQLTVEGYEYQPPALGTPDLGQDQTVCISQGTLTLNTAPVTGASTYEWVVNSNTVSGANTNSYNLTLAAGTHEVIVRAIRAHPNWGNSCADTTADTILVTVTPEPNTTVQVGSTPYDNGSTINVSGTGTSVSASFTASSANTPPAVSYSWALFNPGNTTTTPDATGSGATFTHTFTTSGVHRLILTSDNGGCTERDTLSVNVSLTTALATGSGTVRAYPNPNTGTFTVEVPVGGRYKVQVLDAAGKLVHTQAMENALSQEVRLSVPAGVYQLVVVGEGRREVIRLVVNP